MILDFEKKIHIEIERAVLSKKAHHIGVYMHTTGEYDIYIRVVKRENVAKDGHNSPT